MPCILGTNIIDDGSCHFYLKSLVCGYSSCFGLSELAFLRWATSLILPERLLNVYILANRTTGATSIGATSIRPAGFLLLLLPSHGWDGCSPLPYSSWVWCSRSPTVLSRSHCTVGGIQEKVITATALGIFLRWDHPLLKGVAEALLVVRGIYIREYLCIAS